MYYLAVGAPMETARELDDAVMHQSTVIVDSYDGARTESGDIILSKVSLKNCYHHIQYLSAIYRLLGPDDFTFCGIGTFYM